jgi:hypothetical protein
MGKENLEAAKRMLDNNQLDTTDKTLASVQHGVMSSYVEVDLPPERPLDYRQPAMTGARESGQVSRPALVSCWYSPCHAQYSS